MHNKYCMFMHAQALIASYTAYDCTRVDRILIRSDPILALSSFKIYTRVRIHVGVHNELSSDKFKSACMSILLLIHS